MALLLVAFAFINSSSASVAQPAAPGLTPTQFTLQMRELQKVKTTSDLSATQSELNQRRQDKKSIEKQLAQIDATAGLARTFAMRSKLKSLDKDKRSLMADLDQTKIDIRSLEDKAVQLQLEFQKLKQQ